MIPTDVRITVESPQWDNAECPQRIDLVAAKGPSTTNMFTGTLKLTMQQKLLYCFRVKVVRGPRSAKPKKRPLTRSGDLRGATGQLGLSRLTHGQHAPPSFSLTV